MIKRMTAIEYLLNELPHLDSELLRPIIEQAKAMEKEQIIEAWKEGDRYRDEPADIFSEKYYNDIYEKEN